MAGRFKVLFTDPAEKDLNKLDTKIGDRILAKIDLLEVDPFLPSSKRLKGDVTFRLRVGDYRVIYEVDNRNKQVIIYRVRHRKDVYK
jgi:mRNA interferase RelE/StbE